MMGLRGTGCKPYFGEQPGSALLRTWRGPSCLRSADGLGLIEVAIDQKDTRQAVVTPRPASSHGGPSCRLNCIRAVHVGVHD